LDVVLFDVYLFGGGGVEVIVCLMLIGMFVCFLVLLVSDVA